MKKLFNSLYLLNILFQAIATLLTPIALGALISYLLTSYAGAPSWIYAPIILLGVFSGLFAMVKFILSATAALERLEKQQSEKRTDIKKNNEEK